MNKKSLIFIGVGLLIIIGISFVIIFTREKEEIPLHSLDLNKIKEEAENTQNYEITIEGNNDNKEILIKGKCNTKEHSILADINIATEEEINTTIKYTFPPKEKKVTQEIYYENEMLATNYLEQAEEIELSSIDTSQLLSFFANFLDTNSSCEQERCTYKLNEDEIQSLNSYLSFITLDSSTQYLNDLEELTINYIIVSTKINKIEINFSNTKKLTFQFEY